jgi:hypothetical protein
MMEETNVDKIRVPKDVLDGLEAVRQSGLTNMLDRPVVTRLAEEMGFDAAAEWIEAHRKEYAAGIFRGFEAEEDE